MQAGKEYLETLLSYYEEEVSGETYFYGLINHFGEEEKLTLLARVERRAAESVVPLLQKYNLIPRNEAVLKTVGEGHAERNEHTRWRDFMTYMVTRYQGYLDDFARLENMAPEGDLYALNTLTEHEVAAIEFAEKELAGDPDSVAPLRRYLQL